MIARLKSLVDLITSCGSDTVRPYLALEHIEVGTGRLFPDIELSELTTPASGAAAVEAGDVLFGKLRPYLAKTWLADRAVFASTELLCLRPRSRINARWLSYVCASRPLVEWAVATSDGTKMPRTSWEKLSEYRLWIPPVDTQHAIADFLDIEIARIEALIAKKHHMIDLVQEKVRQSMSAVFAEYGFNFPCKIAPDWKTVPLPFGWRVVRLSQVLVRLTNGYVGPTRDILADSGVRYIQSLHIKDGEINFDRRPFYVSHDWHSARPRIHLRAGDVLIVQTGDIGNVAVVPEEFGPASCHALQIARVRHDMLSGTFLAEYLRTPFGYKSLVSRATGALHPHLEGGIRDVPVILPPKGMQSVILQRIGNVRQNQKKLQSRLVQQIALLSERRQALITAMVTGEMDVPGVSA